MPETRVSEQAERGARIGALRENAGMSQRELAHAADLSQSTLSRIESGTRPARSDELVALAWALGVGIEKLTQRSLLRERVQVAARTTNGQVDAEQVRTRLVGYLEMGSYLDTHGVARVR